VLVMSTLAELPGPEKIVPRSSLSATFIGSLRFHDKWTCVRPLLGTGLLDMGYLFSSSSFLHPLYVYRIASAVIYTMDETFSFFGLSPLFSNFLCRIFFLI
jgi:hypothetical protein